jgi:hypothetical protein
MTSIGLRGRKLGKKYAFTGILTPSQALASTIEFLNHARTEAAAHAINPRIVK